MYFNYRDPSWFNESWLARIKEDVGDNVRLKVGLFFFYALVLKSNFENMSNVMLVKAKVFVFLYFHR